MEGNVAAATVSILAARLTRAVWARVDMGRPW
jgi:hypothetical protein